MGSPRIIFKKKLEEWKEMKKEKKRKKTKKRGGGQATVSYVEK